MNSYYELFGLLIDVFERLEDTVDHLIARNTIGQGSAESERMQHEMQTQLRHLCEAACTLMTSIEEHAAFTKVMDAVNHLLDLAVEALVYRETSDVIVHEHPCEQHITP
jgi:hypothetical protein